MTKQVPALSTYVVVAYFLGDTVHVCLIFICATLYAQH